MEKKEPTRIAEIEISDLPQTEREGVDDSKDLLGEQYLARLTEEERERALLQAAATRKWIEANYPSAEDSTIEERKRNTGEGSSNAWLFQEEVSTHFEIHPNLDNTILREQVLREDQEIRKNLSLDKIETLTKSEVFARVRMHDLSIVLDIQDETVDTSVFLKDYGSWANYTNRYDLTLNQNDRYIQVLEDRLEEPDILPDIILHELVHINSESQVSRTEQGITEVTQGFRRITEIPYTEYNLSIQDIDLIVDMFRSLEDVTLIDLGINKKESLYLLIDYIRGQIFLSQDLVPAITHFIAYMDSNSSYNNLNSTEKIRQLCSELTKLKERQLTLESEAKLRRENEKMQGLPEELLSDIPSEKIKISIGTEKIDEVFDFDEAVVEFLTRVGMSLKKNVSGEIVFQLNNFDVGISGYRENVRKIYSILTTLIDVGVYDQVDTFIQKLGHAEKHSDPQIWIDYMHENFSTIITDEDGNPKHIGVKIEFEKLLRAEIDYIPEQIKEYYQYQKAASL